MTPKAKSKPSGVFRIDVGSSFWVRILDSDSHLRGIAEAGVTCDSDQKCNTMSSQLSVAVNRDWASIRGRKKAETVVNV